MKSFEGVSVLILALLATAGFAGRTGIAQAQAGGGGPHACVAETDDAKRLACYDRQMGRRAASADNARPALGPPARQDSRKPQEHRSREDRQESRESPPRLEAPRASRPQPLVARVVKVWQLEPYVIAIQLDNGQTWKQTESANDLYIEPRESVTIRAASFGSFLLITAGGRSIRVVRIR